MKNKRSEIKKLHRNKTKRLLGVKKKNINMKRV